MFSVTMKGFVDNIERLTDENTLFRKVLYTGHSLQLVLMAIQPGEQIGEEVHDDRDQFFRIEAGAGTTLIVHSGGKEQRLPIGYGRTCSMLA